MPLQNKQFKYLTPQKQKKRRLTLKSAYEAAQERVNPYVDKILALADEIKQKHPKISLTKEQIQNLLVLVAAGHSFYDAFLLTGLSKTTMQTIRKEFPIVEQALQTAKAIAVEYAVFCLLEHMKHDWRPAAWYLERARPDIYGKVDQLKISGIPQEPIIVKFAKAMHEELKKRDKELRPDPAKAIEAEATVEEEPEEDGES